jgi:hypothetical protein
VDDGDIVECVGDVEDDGDVEDVRERCEREM